MVMASTKKAATAPEVKVDDKVTYYGEGGKAKEATVEEVREGGVVVVHVAEGDYRAVCEFGIDPGQWSEGN